MELKKRKSNEKFQISYFLSVPNPIPALIEIESLNTT
jgi:hypothetical protein